VRKNKGTGRKVLIMGIGGGCFSSDSQGYTNGSNHGSSSHYQNRGTNVCDLQPYSDLINGTSHRKPFAAMGVKPEPIKRRHILHQKNNIDLQLSENYCFNFDHS
jgi:hypothetical protein